MQISNIPFPQTSKYPLATHGIDSAQKTRIYYYHDTNKLKAESGFAFHTERRTMSMKHRNLHNLRKAMERQTGKKIMVHFLTRSNGRKLFEIIIDADNPLSSFAVHMEESSVNYRENWVEHILLGTMTVYEKYKRLVETNCNFNDRKDLLHLRLMNYERNKHCLKSLPCHRFLDLATVPVFALKVDIEESTFSIIRNIQTGECQNRIKELFQTAYENEKNDCIIEPIEFSAEELGFDTFLMSNSFHCATMNRHSLRKLAMETQNEHLYLIPASTYEILVIPEDNIYDMAELKDFSQRITESLDTEDTFLSNNIYRYSIKTNSLEVIS